MSILMWISHKANHWKFAPPLVYVFKLNRNDSEFSTEIDIFNNFPAL
jgi:hypothetical protein